jgi:hypothetical protein
MSDVLKRFHINFRIIATKGAPCLTLSKDPGDIAEQRRLTGGQAVSFVGEPGLIRQALDSQAVGLIPLRLPPLKSSKVPVPLSATITQCCNCSRGR